MCTGDHPQLDLAAAGDPFAEEGGRPADEGTRGLSRRGFLRTAAVGAAVAGGGAVLAQPAAAETARASGGGRHRVPTGRISIQLYTLRDQLEIDLEGTLARLAEIGYRRVEHAGFVGRTATQFRAALDRAGLRATSGHSGIPQPFDASAWAQTLADARTVGSTYVVHPFFGVDEDGLIRDRARWTAFARDLDRAGQMAREAGLRFGYHNHQHEFLRLVDGSGRTAFDVLVAETSRLNVHFEVDLFWAWRGATDPVDLARRLGHRILQYHVKDLDTDGSFADVGQGLIDFARIFSAHAVAEYIVERDDAGTDPRTPADALETAEVGYDYLRSLRY
jgi:sugar phosphate isomerase/epimerase